MKFWTSMMGYPEKRDLRKIRGCPERRKKTLCPENMGHRTNSRAPPNFSDVPCFTNIIFFECPGFFGGPVPMSRLSWITCFFVLVGSYIKLSSSLNFFVLPQVFVYPSRSSHTPCLRVWFRTSALAMDFDPNGTLVTPKAWSHRLLHGKTPLLNSRPHRPEFLTILPGFPKSNKGQCNIKLVHRYQAPIERYTNRTCDPKGLV